MKNKIKQNEIEKLKSSWHFYGNIKWNTRCTKERKCEWERIKIN